MTFDYPTSNKRHPRTPLLVYTRKSSRDNQGLYPPVYRRGSLLDFEDVPATSTPRLEDFQLFSSRLPLISYSPSDLPAQAVRSPSRLERVLSFLLLIQTLGITRLYFNLFRYDPQEGSQHQAERGHALPYLHSYSSWSDIALHQIDSSWKGVLGLSSCLVLASVLGLFQWLPSCNNAMFSSLVLVSFILTSSSIICGTLLTAISKNLSTAYIAEKWRTATSYSCAFWLSVSLPLVLLSWGVLFCFTAVFYVSFTGFGAGTGTTSCGSIVLPPILGGLFVLGVALISVILIYNAMMELMDN